MAFMALSVDECMLFLLDIDLMFVEVDVDYTACEGTVLCPHP